MIIDFHTHLGNILIKDGGKIANKKVRKRYPFDPDIIGRTFSYNSSLITKINDSYAMRKLVSLAEQKRCMMSSRDNLLYYMDKHGIDKSVALSIAPNVTFDDIYQACKDNNRLIPFGSVDFTKDNIKDQVKRQLDMGAKGFKIHPILQRVKADSPKMHEMMSACPDGTVILAHTGYSDYYTKKYQHMQKIEYGDFASFAKLASDFPKINFVAAHAGLRELEDAISALPQLKNVWVDITFQSSRSIKKMIKSFGADRVLYASDWPYGFQKTAIKCVKKAVNGDKELIDKIFHKNAEELLNL